MSKMRRLMDQIYEAQKSFVRQAPEVIPFPRPHYGVHVRMWGEHPGITIECDPGYAGIGVALTPDEARGLGEALIRAANAAEEVERKRKRGKNKKEEG